MDTGDWSRNEKLDGFCPCGMGKLEFGLCINPGTFKSCPVHKP
jgi:hypothetical protein